MKNSGLGRINTSRFDRGRGLAQRTAKAQLEIILIYSKALNNVRRGEKLLSDAKDMNEMANNPFTEPQMSYIDSIYEKTMKGMGFPSYSRKHDIRKELRH